MDLRLVVSMSIIPILLAGCLGLPGEDRGVDPLADCWTHLYWSVNHLAGAWENATGPDDQRMAIFPAVPPWGGVAVGSEARSVLGTDGNITSVTWRIDADSDAKTSDHPRVWLSGVVEDSGPRLSGSLKALDDPDRSQALAMEFLEAVRGPHEDNEDYARSFAQQLALGVPEPVHQPEVPGGKSPEDLEPARDWPPRVVLPRRPWLVQEQLDKVVDNATLEDRNKVFAHSAWEWGISIPTTSAGVMGADSYWIVDVDARDQVSMEAFAADPFGSMGFTEYGTVVLERLGLPEAEWRFWEIHLDRHRYFCPDEDDPQPGTLRVESLREQTLNPKQA